MDLLCKSMNWFKYDRDLHHEKVKFSINSYCNCILCQNIINTYKFFIVPLDTERKLNVPKTLKRRPGSLPSVCVHLFDVMCPGVTF